MYPYCTCRHCQPPRSRYRRRHNPRPRRKLQREAGGQEDAGKLKERAKELRLEGLTHKEIASELKIPIGTLASWLRGILIPDPRRNQALELCRTTRMSRKEIAELLGLVVSTVRKWCRGIPRPRNLLKRQAQDLYETRMPRKEIAEKLGTTIPLIDKWCRDINRPEHPLKQQAQKLCKTTDMTQKEISDLLGVAQPTIGKWCRGILRPSNKLMRKKKLTAKKLYQTSDLSLDEISEISGISRWTIRNYCKGLERFSKPRYNHRRNPRPRRKLQRREDVRSKGGLSKAQIAKLVVAFWETGSVKTAAEQTGVSRYFARKYLADEKQLYQGITEFYEAWVQNLCRTTNLTYRKIGETLGISEGMVATWCEDIERPKCKEKKCLSKKYQIATDWYQNNKDVSISGTALKFGLNKGSFRSHLKVFHSKLRSGRRRICTSDECAIHKYQDAFEKLKKTADALLVPEKGMYITLAQIADSHQIDPGVWYKHIKTYHPQLSRPWQLLNEKKKKIIAKAQKLCRTTNLTYKEIGEIFGVALTTISQRWCKGITRPTGPVDPRIEQAGELYRKGVSVEKIRQRLRASTKTVKKWLIEAGLYKTEEQKRQDVIEAYQQQKKKSFTKAARVARVTPLRAKEWLIETGLYEGDLRTEEQKRQDVIKAYQQQKGKSFRIAAEATHVGSKKAKEWLIEAGLYKTEEQKRQDVIETYQQQKRKNIRTAAEAAHVGAPTAKKWLIEAGLIRRNPRPRHKLQRYEEPSSKGGLSRSQIAKLIADFWNKGSVGYAAREAGIGRTLATKYLSDEMEKHKIISEWAKKEKKAQARVLYQQGVGIDELRRRLRTDLYAIKKWIADLIPDVDPRIEQARELYQQGVNIKQIGRRLRADHYTAKKWIADLIPDVDPRIEQARELYQQGVDIKQISRRLRAGRPNIKKWIADLILDVDPRIEQARELYQQGVNIKQISRRVRAGIPNIKKWIADLIPDVDPRIEQARELYQQGVSMNKISRRVRAGPPTIKKWIADLEPHRH